MGAPSKEFLEHATHGNADFPVGFYPDLSTQFQDQFYLPHWHPEIEIDFIICGKIEMLISGESFIADTGSVVIIPPNVLHAALPLNRNNSKLSALVFSEQLIHSFSPDLIERKVVIPFLSNGFKGAYCLPSYMETNDELRHLYSRLNYFFSTAEPTRELLIKGIIIELIAIILRSSIPSHPSNRNIIQERRQKQVMLFISNHFADQITAAEISRSINLSVEQCTRFFKQAFRTTPMRYLNLFRIQQACILLSSSGLTVTEIASDVGFGSANYFAATFKRITGSTPSEYRFHK